MSKSETEPIITMSEDEDSDNETDVSSENTADQPKHPEDFSDDEEIVEESDNESDEDSENEPMESELKSSNTLPINPLGNDSDDDEDDKADDDGAPGIGPGLE